MRCSSHATNGIVVGSMPPRVFNGHLVGKSTSLFRDSNEVAQARIEDAVSTPTARPPAAMSMHHKETEVRAVV